MFRQDRAHKASPSLHLSRTLCSEKDAHGDCFKNSRPSGSQTDECRQAMAAYRVPHQLFTLCHHASSMKLHVYFTGRKFTRTLTGYIFCIIGNLCSLRLQECMALHIT